MATIEEIYEDVVICKLTELNKSDLFRETVQTFQLREEGARATLRRLQQLNSDIGNYFGLKTTAISHAPFRLLFSKNASLLVNSSSKVTSYIAVSYCWHSEAWQAVNEALASPWPFSDAMAQAVLDARLSEDEGIWVDQYSIDQRNEAEKELAIASMDVIYYSARRLIILLEDVQLSEEEEKVTMKYLNVANLASRPWNPSESEVLILLSLFRKIVSARWFSRAWCSHEFKIGKHWQATLAGPVVQHPTFRLYSENGGIIKLPAVFFSKLWLFVDRISSIPLSHREQLTSTQQLSSRWQYLSRESPVQASRTSLERSSYIAEIFEMSRFGCGINSDRIQIAMNLSGIPLCYKGPTSKNESECHFIFTLLALASGEVSVLGLTGPSIEICRQDKSFLSWARLAYNAQYELRLAHFVEDIGISSATPALLDIDLLFLEKPPESASAPAKLIADSLVSAQFFDREFPEGCFGEGDQIIRKRVLHLKQVIAQGADWSQYLRQVIACSIDCGVKWIKKAWAIFEEGIIRNDWIMEGKFGPFDQDNGLSQAAHEFLRSQGLDPNDPSNYETFYLPVLNYLAFITDPRLASTIKSEQIVRIPTSPYGDYALIKQMAPQYKLAVPVALADQSLTINRVWVLKEVGQSEIQPADLIVNTDNGVTPPDLKSDRIDIRSLAKEPVWQVVRKVAMLGCPTLVPDGEVVSLRRNQRVRGGPFDYEKVV